MNELTTADWLAHAREHAKECARLVADCDLVQFCDERRTQFAIYYGLIVVGEALNRVPREVRALAPDIPWEQPVGLRNRLVHAYWLTDPEIIFQIVTAQCPLLVESLDGLIETLK